eukprot:957304-Rhodomonas_salina.2
MLRLDHLRRVPEELSVTLRDIYGATSNVELKVTLPSRAVLGRERERRDTTRTEREQQVNFKEQEGPGRARSARPGFVIRYLSPWHHKKHALEDNGVHLAVKVEALCRSSICTAIPRLKRTCQTGPVAEQFRVSVERHHSHLANAGEERHDRGPWYRS